MVGRLARLEFKELAQIARDQRKSRADKERKSGTGTIPRSLFDLVETSIEVVSVRARKTLSQNRNSLQSISFFAFLVRFVANAFRVSLQREPLHLDATVEVAVGTRGFFPAAADGFKA
jgi:hypothetical protein